MLTCSAESSEFLLLEQLGQTRHGNGELSYVVSKTEVADNALILAAQT